MRIVTNKTGSQVTILITGTETIKIAGNSSVSNLCTAGETVTGATILNASYGSIGGSSGWTVTRGANTVAVFGDTGQTNYDAAGPSMILDPTGDLTATLTGTAGYLMLTLQKASIVTKNQYLVG